MSAKTTQGKRLRESQEDNQLAEIEGTPASEEKEGDPTKKQKTNSKTMAQMREERKAEQDKAFGFKALVNSLNISDEVRMKLCECLASDGAADIDIKSLTEHNRNYSLEQASSMDLEKFIQMIQRSQTFVQGSKGNLRLNGSSLPKAVKNFIIVTLTIVSKTISQIESDMVKSKNKIQEWAQKTATMEEAEAEKVKIDISGIEGDFLATDKSKRAYVGMLNEENRFKTNYIYLSDYFVKAGIIKVDNA